MTTYYLSKLITIKGIIKNIDPSSNQNQRILNSDRQELIQEQYIQNELRNKPQKKIKRQINQYISYRSVEKKQIMNEEKQPSFIQFPQQFPQISKIIRKQFKIPFLRFQVTLDRDQQVREKLASNLMKEEQKYIDVLNSLKQQQPWKRTQNDYDTSFTYHNLNCFKTIDQGIKSVEDMFPYALLFNPKLYQIQILDKRTKNKMGNMTITKKPQKKRGDLKISSCLIKKDQKQQTVDLAYKINKQTNSIVCVPIQIEQKKIKILSVGKKISKIFKQLPLLGCQDTGYNFVFTSRKFYPDEKRSKLLLKLAEGKPNKQANQNLRVLPKILCQGIQLYKVLMFAAENNIENFYKITDKNFFEQSHRYFQIFVEQIRNLEVIPNLNGNKKVALRDIIYFTEKSLEISNQMNSLFYFFFDIAISKATHKSLYDNLSLETWKNKVKFVTLRQVLQLIAKIGYEKLCTKFRSSQILHKYLKKIYEFLAKHKLNEFRSYNSEVQIKFILTNKNQLQRLNKLKKKYNLPKAYEYIAEQLGIDIQKNFIKDSFEQYFEGLPQFSFKNMEQSFEDFFEPSDRKNFGQKKLKLLIKFCRTFNFAGNVLELVGSVFQYADTSAFTVDTKVLNKLQKNKQILYTKLLLFNFICQFNNNILMKSDYTVLQIFQKFNPSQNLSIDFVINWWNHLLELQKQYKTNFIKFSISMSMAIKPIKSLKYLEFVPTDQQLDFVNQMNEIFRKNNIKPVQNDSQNQQRNQQSSEIQNYLLHQGIKDKSIYKQMSVQKFFKKSMANYRKDWLEKENLKKFLDFYETIIQQFVNDPNEITRKKLNFFNQVRSKRHKQILQITKLNDLEADSVYKLIKDYKQDLPNLHNILETYGSVEIINEILRKQ